MSVNNNGINFSNIKTTPKCFISQFWLAYLRNKKAEKKH